MPSQPRSPARCRSRSKTVTDYGWRAAIWQDRADPFNGTVQVVVHRRGPAGSAEVLRGDGSVQIVPEGAAPDGNNIVLPSDAIEPIRAAIERWQGSAGNPVVEAKVLREWLAVERGRVDRALAREQS